MSSGEKASFVKQLGADLPILYRETDFVQAAREWTEGKGVHLAFDTVGGALLEQTFGAVRIYGDVVTILAPDPATNWQVARDRNLRTSLELMLTPMLQDLREDQKHQARLLEDCTRWFEQGLLKIHLAQTFPLAEAAAAHRLLAQGGMMGKVVLEL